MKKEKPFLTIDDDVQKEMGITQRSIDNLNKKVKFEISEETLKVLEKARRPEFMEQEIEKAEEDLK